MEESRNNNFWRFLSELRHVMVVDDNVDRNMVVKGGVLETIWWGAVEDRKIVLFTKVN